MNNVIYQQDGAPPHCSNVSLDFLNKYFPGDRLISRRTNNPCPAYSGADLGGGWGGCIPPTSLKVTISTEKSASISKN